MPVATGKHTADITAEVGGQHNVDKLHKISRDFRTDTITIPTDAQLLAALTATRGDDVYGEDAATRELEERIARLTGKEAAMFGSSGTMTNQIAIRVHMKSPPQSVLVDHRAHIHCMEAGGIAMFTQATTYSVVPSNGEHMTLEDIKPNLRLGEDIHYAPTKLICLENTLSGMVFPQGEVVRIGDMAKSHGIAMHLDGARIFEVAAKEVEARGLDPRKEEDIQTVLTELCAPFDSASLCLSKGIGAPVGSATVGTKEFIARAKWFRKAFGGGVRQIGPTAAAADHAITHHFPRLAGTHALARRLGEGLKELGVDIIAPIHTNMVFFDPTPIGVPIEAIFARLAALDDPITVKYNRLVIHHQTSPQAVEDLIACVREMKSEVEDGKGQQVKVEGQDVARDPAMQQEKKIRQQTLGY